MTPPYRGHTVSQVTFASPADVELVDDPIPPHWVIAGSPQARSQRLAYSADGTSSTMAWSCTAGRFNWHYSVDETLHIIAGEVFVTDEKGQTHRLAAGDMVFFPAGTSSIWNVPHFVRKIAFCRHAMPRPAGLVLRVWNKVARRLRRFSSGAASGAVPRAMSGADTGVRAGGIAAP
jgi:uncharacterized protein